MVCEFPWLRFYVPQIAMVIGRTIAGLEWLKGIQKTKIHLLYCGTVACLARSWIG